MLDTSYIGQVIEVSFDQPPLHSKTPTCPSQFIWGQTTYTILSLLAEWRDYERRGRMSNNMRPQNLTRARKRGSWGVGRFYFRVLVKGEKEEDNGRCFELYYDRAPKGQKQKNGQWFLDRELFP